MDPKVTVSLFAGAAANIIMTGVNRIPAIAVDPLPPDMVGWVTVLIMAGVAYLTPSTWVIPLTKKPGA